MSYADFLAQDREYHGKAPLRPVAKRTFKIDRDVPIGRRTQGKRVVWPFQDMRVGDSFLVRPRDVDIRRSLPEIRDRAREAARSFIKRNGLKWRFSTSMIEAEDGVRIWRVE